MIDVQELCMYLFSLGVGYHYCLEEVLYCGAGDGKNDLFVGGA